MYDVVALGELLVDFTPCGVRAQELPVYQANPGGAPCNVLSRSEEHTSELQSR